MRVLSLFSCVIVVVFGFFVRENVQASNNFTIEDIEIARKVLSQAKELEIHLRRAFSEAHKTARRVLGTSFRKSGTDEERVTNADLTKLRRFFECSITKEILEMYCPSICDEDSGSNEIEPPPRRDPKDPKDDDSSESSESKESPY